MDALIRFYGRGDAEKLVEATRDRTGDGARGNEGGWMAENTWVPRVYPDAWITGGSRKSAADRIKLSAMGPRRSI